jgi:Spy/CpxP family protein refolding chaperone
MKKLFIILTAAAALAASGFTYQTHAADTSGLQTEHGRPFQRIAQMLNLTDSQQAQIRTILIDDRGTLVPLLSKMHNARKSLREAIRASDANEATVRAAAANVAAVEADLAVERMKLYGKIAPILTEAQLKELADLQQLGDDAVDNALARLGSGLDN